MPPISPQPVTMKYTGELTHARKPKLHMVSSINGVTIDWFGKSAEEKCEKGRDIQ
jgi:hypothetical protein